MRMEVFLKKETNKARKKLSGIRGMTMAELLIVVAIIAILSGVAFIAVQRHQRSLGQLERDGLAKEIFVAAQNHLTAVYGQGYLDLPTNDAAIGNPDTISRDSEGNDIKDDYYFVVNGSISNNSVLGQMLPFGSLDETVRLGGSYFVHYQKSTGLVLDVSYCSVTGTPGSFNHTFSEADYVASVGLRGDSQKRNRRSIGGINGYIMGWYGAEDANLETIKLEAPTINIINAEKLHVEVIDTNTSNDYTLKLLVTGSVSGAKKSFTLLENGNFIMEGDPKYDPRVSFGSERKFDIVLDDITKSNMRFADIKSENAESFIPGEDIIIQAKAVGTKAFSNIAYSSEEKENSLFSDIKDGNTDDISDIAYIRNIRHLENLDGNISGLNQSGTEKIDITDAIQTKDLDWNEFCSEIARMGGSDSSSVQIYTYDEDEIITSSKGSFMPMSPTYNLTYDGKRHSISNVKVEDNVYAGLFGNSSSINTIKNLELIDFDIRGTTSAGALAGTLDGTTIINVIARNSSDTPTTNVTATGFCGGLVGEITAGEVLYSAASVIVNAGTSGTAGGLIGTSSSDTTKITGSYSGGHTKYGSYEEWLQINSNVYDVTGATAGGLVGDANGAEITNSYSTCSVSGAIAGGFVGSASGVLTNCYATGLIKMDDASASDANTTKGAFAGDFEGTASKCKYYSIINEVKMTKGEKEIAFDYLGAVGDKEKDEVTAVDNNVGSYESFVGAKADWSNAEPYDNTDDTANNRISLLKYYTNKYNLQSIKRLEDKDKPTFLPDDYKDDKEEKDVNWDDLFIDTHYGDWPAPEIFVLNTATTS